MRKKNEQLQIHKQIFITPNKLITTSRENRELYITLLQDNMHRTLIEHWMLQTDSNKYEVSKTPSQISLVTAHEQACNDLSTTVHTLIC